MKKTFILYLLTLGLFGWGILFALQQGKHLTASHPAMVSERSAAAAGGGGTLGGGPLDSLLENLHHPLGILFVQLIVIVLASRAVGWLFTRFGQPAVIGEMVAGILLGPSLLGWVAPGLFQGIFPAASLGTLKLLSQLGVCLFLFVVGMELDVMHLRAKAHVAVLVSHVSIVFPFFLGVVLSLALYPTLAPANITFLSFALFIGISMSITAFPVLARILQERGMTQTFLGSTAITCAAVDDVTAWSILAFVVAIVNADGLGRAALSVGLAVGFTAVMILVVKPWLNRRLSDERDNGNFTSSRGFTTALVVMLVSALVTEVIGIHALFGAFLAGVVMPANSAFRESVKVRLTNFSASFLLPLFFAFTGLRTQVGLLNDLSGWLMCLGIICVASLGKLGGSLVTARLTGMNWRDSFALGALMNTRGLMELIALNIGYDLGILSPRIFAMLVLMALVTTFLTGPLLNLADRWPRRLGLAGAGVRSEKIAGP